MKNLKTIGSMALGAALIANGITAHAALAWSPDVTVDRVSPVYGTTNKIYVTVTSGSNNIPAGPFCTGGAYNNVRYMWLAMSDDAQKFTFSTLLTLMATGKKAKFSVENGGGTDCRLVTVEPCGANSCETF